MNLSYYNGTTEIAAATQRHSRRGQVQLVSLGTLMRGLTAKVRDLFERA